MILKLSLNKLNCARLKTTQRNYQFLLFEHILCEESIIIGKKFDFEILMYLYILRFPEFIYAIFEVMYVCVCMYM